MVVYGPGHLKLDNCKDAGQTLVVAVGGPAYGHPV